MINIAMILISIIVPFVSVWFSFKITKQYNEKQYESDQRIQRVKHLTLLHKEAVMYKEYQIQKSQHRSKEFITTKLILESPSFNVDEHGEIIELAFEMERINQNLDIAVGSLTRLSTSILAGYISNLSRGNLLLTFYNSKFFKALTGKTHAEKVTESVQTLIEKGIQDSTKEALPVIEKILLETERLITLDKRK